MPHSSIVSGRPAFRTADVIRTPVDVRVTARKSITVKMGRDDAPQDTKLTGTIGGRQSIATELAKVEPSYALETGEVRTYGSRTPLDRVAGVFRTEKGHYVRTVAMGDDSDGLGTLVAAMLAAAPTNPVRPESDSAPKIDRKAERKAEDAAMMGYLRTLGWEGTRLTPQLRQRVLDVLEQAKQLAAYAS